MKSELVKVLHPLAGRPMIVHVVDTVGRVGATRIVCVVGYQGDRVRAVLADRENVELTVQEEPLGTGHALECAVPNLDGFGGDVLVCCGDTPLLTEELLRALLDDHRRTETPATMLVATVEDASGYGRVVTDGDHRVAAIVEEVDADADTLAIRQINAGVYCFHWPTVQPLLAQLGIANTQGERYLTDIMELLSAAGTPGRLYEAQDEQEIQGINDRVQLAIADAVLRDRIRQQLMRSGVTFLAPETSLIDAGVRIGQDTVVHPGVIIGGRSVIGSNSVIGPFSHLLDAIVGDGVELRGWNHIVRTNVPNESIIGPYVQQGTE
jgi:bifunctional UDP-N-acetylglucosamine pyrophosphorylase/glucosamine-1-phosphate N-acetyltransferase